MEKTIPKKFKCPQCSSDLREVGVYIHKAVFIDYYMEFQDNCFELVNEEKTDEEQTDKKLSDYTKVHCIECDGELKQNLPLDF